MKAFLEILSGIIRVGPDCDTYGKPFEYAVSGSSVDGKTFVLKALVSDGKLTPSHVKAAVNLLKDQYGFEEVTWERHK